MPSQLVGPPEHIAEQLLARRERYGVTYYQVPDGVMEEFAAVIALLAGRRPTAERGSPGVLVTPGDPRPSTGSPVPGS